MFTKKKNLLIIGCCIFIISGCSSSKKNKDVQQASVNQPKKSSNIKELYIELVADKQLNLSQDNQPLSVMIKIYQLKDSNAFLQSNYKNLLKEANDDVKQDTLTKYDITVKPTDKILLHRPLEKDTVYIGIVAFFNKPDLQKNNWKIIIRRNNLLKKKPRIIEVNANVLSLIPTKKELKKQGEK